MEGAVMSIWEERDAKKAASDTKQNLRKSRAEKFQRDVTISKTEDDAEAKYEESQVHRSLGNGNFKAVDMIGDATPTTNDPRI